MAANAFHMFVTLLAFSHLFFMANAVSTSGRSIKRHMLHETSADTAASGNMYNNQMVMDETVLEEEFMSGRMDLEKTDYPGPGANNHHTPKPPQSV